MRLAAVDITPINTDIAVYTVPAGKRVVFSLDLCNRGTGLAKVRVALTDGAAPAVSDWIEYDAPLSAAGSPGGSTAQRTGLILAPGQKLFVRTDVATVSAVVYGILETL